MDYFFETKNQKETNIFQTLLKVFEFPDSVYTINSLGSLSVLSLSLR